MMADDPHDPRAAAGHDADDADALLGALGAREREHRRQETERALGAWAEGRLEAQQAREQAGITEDDPRAELFAPLSADLEARIAARALAALKAPAMATPAKPIGAVAAARQDLPGPRASSQVRARRWLWAGAGTLAAAALWLLLAPLPLSSGPGLLLPAYELRVEGGDRDERGNDPGAHEPNTSTKVGPGGADQVTRALAADSTLTITLRPASAVEGPLEARLFVRPLDAPALVASPVPAEIALGGAVRWRAPAGQLVAGTRGEVRLLAVVARAGALPSRDELASATRPATDSLRLELTVHVRDPLSH